MTDNRTHDDRQLKTDPPKKKVYRKPEFRYERVFETAALLCGKTSPFQGSCVNSRKTS